MTRNHHSEKGQALVIMVLGMIALLGFTALAIDGGMLYADRRHAQDGADAASWAGAGAAVGYLKEAADNDIAGGAGEDWSCSDTNTVVANAIVSAKSKAIANAVQNDYTITASDDFNANGNIVAVNCVDTGARYLDVRVSITKDTDTSLAHFVYAGPAQNTVDAITRVFPREPIAWGQSIVTLDDDNTCTGSDKGVRFTGGGSEASTVIVEGGIISKSCIIASGNITVSTGSAVYDQNSFYQPSGGGQVNPTPQPVVDNFTFSIPPPPCVGPIDPAPVAGYYMPGRYTSNIQVNTGQTANLNPGLYCFIDGANLSVNGGNITGNGVTFYFPAGGGSFNVGGNGTVQLTPPVEPCPVGDYYSGEDCAPAIPNLLLYIDPANTNPVNIGGNSASIYEGTVYAPKSLVTIGGTNETLSNIGLQVIAWSVKIHGTATLNIDYDVDKTYHTPNYINLEK